MTLSKVSTECATCLTRYVYCGCWVDKWSPALCKLSVVWLTLPRNSSLPHSCSSPSFMRCHPTRVQIRIQLRCRDPQAEFWSSFSALLLLLQYSVTTSSFLETSSSFSAQWYHWTVWIPPFVTILRLPWEDMWGGHRAHSIFCLRS